MSITGALRSPAFRGLLLLVTFCFIGYTLSTQWAEVQQSARALDVQWGWIGAASVVVLATYAMLIQSWRMLLAGWGGTLAYPAAVRIWTIANLGRYLPGKVWSIGALGLLASREGVSGLSATGAAILGTSLNIGAGFAVAVITGAQGLDAIYPGLRAVAIGVAVAFLVGVAVLPFVLPAILDRFARWRGLPLAEQHLSKRTVWLAAGINAFSWISYGIAFGLFAQGVTPGIGTDPVLYIAVWATSYLVGFLVLFAPGGIGFRELAISAFLVGIGAAGQGDVAILGATSRVWLTVLEIAPGLIGLLLMSPSQRAGLRRP
ncbi:lysylphosphatidylglycerol synthase domain-containing protein [Gemmatimonas phototrophica]|uniref:Lysylphosphatidylglycerol synthetase n=1 Tax=Gemmatimonas phototrophica TaxID=1379270 RepID=A0A143BJY6_9BACT|nr:lysylphosphatidylglycerol synthase domain-containing protein [Gemmatimonas phototrophica]AMW04905.1 hypothetical protein GEMMAAP_08775 [Gemmatimonas phototrophica]